MAQLLVPACLERVEYGGVSWGLNHSEAGWSRPRSWQDWDRSSSVVSSRIGVTSVPRAIIGHAAIVGTEHYAANMRKPKPKQHTLEGLASASQRLHGTRPMQSLENA